MALEEPSFKAAAERVGEGRGHIGNNLLTSF